MPLPGDGLDTDHQRFVAGLGIGGTGFGVAGSTGLGSSDFNQARRTDSAQADSTYLAANATLGLLGRFGAMWRLRSRSSAERNGGEDWNRFVTRAERIVLEAAKRSQCR